MRAFLDIFGPIFRFLASLALALALTAALIAALFYRDVYCDALKTLTGNPSWCSTPSTDPETD